MGRRAGEQPWAFCCPQQHQPALPGRKASKRACGVVLEEVGGGAVCPGASPAFPSPHVPAAVNAAGLRFPRQAPACSAISPVRSRGIIHISDKRIGY